TPSGTALAVELLLHLAELLHDAEYRRRAVFVMESLTEPILRFPSAFGHLLGSADMEVNGAVQIALVGSVTDPEVRALERAVAGKYVPALVIAAGPPRANSLVKLLDDKPAIDEAATAYVCRGYVCDKPATDPAELGEQLESAAKVLTVVTAQPEN
ncbi:MAG TPA: hypothetical protein VIH53_12295, partial [Gemmatimonadaceae bacterium]